jgi:hypothetical protein
MTIEKTAGTNGEPRRRRVLPVIYAILLNLIVSATTVFIYDQYFAQKVVVFDRNGYRDQQKKLFFAGKITEEELFMSLDRVEELMRRENANTVILNAEAVIRNGKFIKP